MIIDPARTHFWYSKDEMQEGGVETGRLLSPSDGQVVALVWREEDGSFHLVPYSLFPIASHPSSWQAMMASALERREVTDGE